MHFFDLFILTIIGLFALMGIRRGLVVELLKIVGLVFAILLALKYVHVGAQELGQIFDAEPERLTVVSFILIIILVMIGFRLLAAMIKRVLQFAMLGWLDRAGGMVFGAIKAAVILSLILWALLLVPENRYTKDLEENTVSYPIILGIAPSLYDALTNWIPGTQKFVEKLEQYIPAIGSDQNLARYKNMTPLEKLQEVMGDQVDPEILKDFSREKIQELLNNPELREELKRRVLEYQKNESPGEDLINRSRMNSKVSKIF